MLHPGHVLAAALHHGRAASGKSGGGEAERDGGEDELFHGVTPLAGERNLPPAGTWG